MVMDEINPTETLSNNVRKVMRVGGKPTNDLPSRISQEALSEISGVNRSTLTSQFLSANGNPKLEQLYRVANGLGVHPAFLLMRASDWTRLAQVVNAYSTLITKNKFVEALSNLLNSSKLNSEQQALIAAQLAKQVDISPDSSNQLPLRRIFANAVLPPLSHMTKGDRAAALFLSTVFSAHYDDKTFFSTSNQTEPTDDLPQPD